MSFSVTAVSGRLNAQQAARVEIEGNMSFINGIIKHGGVLALYIDKSCKSLFVGSMSLVIDIHI